MSTAADMADLQPSLLASADRPMAAVASGAPLPTEDREAQLLWRLRYQIARSSLRQLFTTARLRTSLVVGLSIFFWTGLFVLFYEGFSFIVDRLGTAGGTYHADTFRFVFHLFFLSLNVMLVFSAGIILYTGLFHSPEARFLLTLPVRAERVVLFKFQEALFFSSWGFFLLASPIMVAYGIVNAAPWYYYALLVPLILSFVYIPCSIGAICCLYIIRRMPQLRRIVVAAAALAVIAVTVPAIWQTVNTPESRLFGSDWFNETLQRFRFSQSDWLPSSWMTNCLLEAARPSGLVITANYAVDVPTFKSFMYLALLISNALMLHVVLVWFAKRWFRESYAQFAVRRPPARKIGTSWSDRLIDWPLRLFSEPVRLLFLKDWRLLRRDPAQWSQFLIFFGLLGLYFLNIDRFKNPTNAVGTETWVNMVSFLNLTVVGLILSTFTTRFIYPMVSLEGHCFWILGLLPIDRTTILWSKFWFASIGAWVPCSVLILLSDMMLQVSALVIWIHQLTCVLLCMGLASIAVGLGAMMPNFRETSPSKIAAGFGGTLNLVLSALYIMLIVVFTALPCHFYLLANRSGTWAIAIASPERLRNWLIAGTAAAIATGVLVTVTLLRRGLRSFRHLEFA
jgi:ABC-2 type transport system permease protein